MTNEREPRIRYLEERAARIRYLKDALLIVLQHEKFDGLSTSDRKRAMREALDRYKALQRKV